jgi:hypothetical protein
MCCGAFDWTDRAKKSMHVIRFCTLVFSEHLLLRDFGHYWIIFMNVYILTDCCHGNAVTGFWTLCDSIQYCVCLLLLIFCHS